MFRKKPQRRPRHHARRADTGVACLDGFSPCEQSELGISMMSNLSKGNMDISPKLDEQYCTYYVPLPSSPILLVAVKTLELLGSAVCLLVQF